MDLQEVLNVILEKLHEALLALENLGRQILAWFESDKVSHWLHVALPCVIAAVVVTLVVCLCRCCCRCCCRRGLGRMMKAPGRNCQMPRNVFENDPKGYFLRLRSHPGDQLC